MIETDRAPPRQEHFGFAAVFPMLEAQYTSLQLQKNSSGSYAAELKMALLVATDGAASICFLDTP